MQEALSSPGHSQVSFLCSTKRLMALLKLLRLSPTRGRNLKMEVQITTMQCRVTQLCLTFCEPIDCSPPGSTIHGIFQQEYWSGLPFPVPQLVKNPPAMQETSVGYLGWEDPLEKKKSSHSSTLAWRIRIRTGLNNR